jgi:type IV pilus assembly protein PilA
MNCSQCGRTVPEGATFCPTCGRQTGLTNAGLTGLPSQTTAGLTAPVAAEKTSGMAIASLIFGVLFLFFPLSILAIVFGHVSLSQIKKSAGKLGGKGLAIAGLVLGYLGIAMIPFILIIAAIAIPNLLRARIAANESSAVYSLRTINAAQVTYRSTYSTVGYAPDLQSLGGSAPCTSNPATACLIDNRLAIASSVPGRNGYIFAVARSDDATEYFVSATPVTPNQSGRRTFCSTEDAAVRADPNGDSIPDREACAALPPI